MEPESSGTPKYWLFLSNARYKNRMVDVYGKRQHVCPKCTHDKLRRDSSVVGYLTSAERRRYVNATALSWEYKLNGYIVLNSDQWQTNNSKMKSWPTKIKEMYQRNWKAEDLTVLDTTERAKKKGVKRRARNATLDQDLRR